MKKTVVSLAVVAGLMAGCATDAAKTASGESATDQVAANQSTDPVGETAEEPVEPAEPAEAEEPAGPAITNMPVGNTVSVETAEGQLDVQTVEVQTSSVAPDEYSEPPVNGLNVGVLIQYLCKTGPCDYNPYDFVLRGPDGTEYDQAFVSDLFGPDLSSGTITTGVPAKGWIVFDAPPGSLSLEYRANIFDGEVASWALAVA